MFWPIIASALTTIAAFIPLIFWPDNIGQWLRVIPITVIVVLTASLIVTLIFVPALGSMIERKTAETDYSSVKKSNFLLDKYETVLFISRRLNTSALIHADSKKLRNLTLDFFYLPLILLKNQYLLFYNLGFLIYLQIFLI